MRRFYILVNMWMRLRVTSLQAYVVYSFNILWCSLLTRSLALEDFGDIDLLAREPERTSGK